MSYPGNIPGSKVTMYNSTGKVADNVKLKMWTGTTSTTNSTWTCDISSAGFTTILWVGANARPAGTSPGTSDANFASVNMQQSTTKLIKGFAQNAVTTGLLLATVLNNASCTIDVVVIGI